MTIRIPTLLTALLDAVAREASAKAAQHAIRGTLAAEAARRYAEEGAAPRWSTRGAGVVRWDEPGDPTVAVSDPVAFGSYVAEHHPDQADGVIRVPSAQLEQALAALEFADVTATATVDVRPAWRDAWLEAAPIARDEVDPQDLTKAVVLDADRATGATGIVPGVVARPGSPGRLVVSLDRDRRQEALAAAEADADRIVADATRDEEVNLADVAEAAAVTVVERTHAIEQEHADQLAGLKSDTLKGAARARGLPVGGTKTVLAERLAGAGVDPATLTDAKD